MVLEEFRGVVGIVAVLNAEHGVKQSVKAFTLTALFGEFGVVGTGDSEGFHLVSDGGLRAERLHEMSGFRLVGPDSFRTAALEGFRHGRLVSGFHAAVQGEVRGLECHLHESIGAKGMT